MGSLEPNLVEKTRYYDVVALLTHFFIFLTIFLEFLSSIHVITHNINKFINN